MRGWNTGNVNVVVCPGRVCGPPIRSRSSGMSGMDLAWIEVGSV